MPRALQEAIIARNHGLGPLFALAEHSGTDRDLQYRLLADPDWRIRLAVVARMPLTDEDLAGLLSDAADPSPDALMTTEEILGELDFAVRHDARLQAVAVRHPDPRIRVHALNVPEYLPLLAADAVDTVRLAAERRIAEHQRIMQPADLPPTHTHGFWSVLQRPLSRALIDQVMSDEQALYFVGTNPSTPADVVEALTRHPSAEVRRRLAERAELSDEQLLRLAADPDAGVRTRVSVHPGLTEEQRAAIDIDLTTMPEDGHYGPARKCPQPHPPRHGDERPPSLDDARRWAPSVNPLLRRRAARNGELPHPLTDDPDLGVRVLTALHHPAAPPDLLLRCFLEHTGCGRDQLAAHPLFPVAGLARFADDGDPAVRRLVARDPQAGPQVIARLLGDPDKGVRREMASCPRLPEAQILALLDDGELAEHAAANPSLPIERIYQP
ncbi:hypothetical protein OWR29_38615 [Actinoplanes sp. Pm04-4]|uniref:Leucine rich repeat variant n=1 Tax=Paractinoplanes pyxinae TaxID=2997416 RepID=A0ABT4BBP8_9ACTN|nr:hypothetical protein [Actinoplanes pyxinae]MCY1143944.1 hypothetical protein [Actinoplanes pyxinae]